MHITSPARLLITALAASSLLFGGCGGDGGGGGGGGTPAQSCTLDGDCPTGQKCIDKICKAGDGGFVGGDVGSSSGATDGGGSSSGAADAGASSGGTSGSSGSSGSSSGGTNKNLCAACQNDKECADGYGCVLLFNSETHNFCLSKCDSAADCTPGFFCTKANSDSEQQFCVPPNSKCDGCTLTGCDAGKKCDYAKDPPVCADAGAACAACKVDNDCANGHSCLSVGGAKTCVPNCAGGGSCPANSTCQKFDTTSACISNAAECCYGDSCKPADACASCKDKCFAGKCVDCLTDDQCPDGKCVLSQHTCEQKSCSGNTPHKQPQTGLCVECLNDTHCAGKKCLQNKCSDGGQQNECSLCKDPYPGCVQINGQWSCVECGTDDDCKKKGAGNCSPKTYTCSGTVNGGGPTTGKCKSDADCPAGTTSFDLACDSGTGLCYDKNGRCDGLTAFCNAAKGSKCVPLADIAGLPGGGGGGGIPNIPGLPGGSGSGPGGGGPGDGVCTCANDGGGSGGCSYDDSICKILSMDKKGCDCCADANSKACTGALGSCCQKKSAGGGTGGAGNPFIGLLDCFAKAQTGTKDPACFGATSCLNTKCLTEAMSGGASTGTGPKGYCSGQNAAKP